MHVLFIHQAFPAQFGRLAFELARTRRWRVSALVESMSACPTPTAEMLEAVEIHSLASASQSAAPIPWPLAFGEYVQQCRRVYEALSAKPELQPDLVVAHGGRGAPILFVPEALPCPIVVYCEYAFAASHCDLSYRIDLPQGDEDVERLFPRCINAPPLMALMAAHLGYAPTHWQKKSFPSRFHERIEVAFDGVDTKLYRPGRASRPYTLAGRTIDHDTQVVTFVARGLESMRGFDIFLRVAERIAAERADVLFVVVGARTTYYGWDLLRTGGQPFAEWAWSRVNLDSARVLELGHVEPAVLADILSLSNLHLYLSVPFVTSWSFFNALSAGAVVLASDIEPIYELVQRDVHALVAPLFDVDRLAETALRVLDDPAAFAPLASAGRERVLERYSLDVCIPALARLFERAASIHI